MIDFNNATFLKLRPAGDNAFQDLVTPVLVQDEEIICTFIAMRDGVVFTTKRIIAINVQGVTGAKKDLTSLPYARIQAFSIRDVELLSKYGKNREVAVRLVPCAG